MNANQCMAGYNPPANLNNEDTNGTDSNYGERLRAFIDITVLAFKCDTSRTFTLTFESEAGQRVLGNVVPKDLVYGQGDVSQGFLDTHLSISHWSSNSGTPGPGSEQQRSDRCVTRDRYYLSHFAYMIKELKAATDPSGASILDNTAILCGHCFQDGSHTQRNEPCGLPLVLGGGRNFLKPGNMHMVNSTMQNFLVTIANGVANIQSFAGSTGMVNI
jgi:hypothetical protein